MKKLIFAGLLSLCMLGTTFGALRTVADGNGTTLIDKATVVSVEVGCYGDLTLCRIYLMCNDVTAGIHLYFDGRDAQGKNLLAAALAFKTNGTQVAYARFVTSSAVYLTPTYAIDKRLVLLGSD